MSVLALSAPLRLICTKGVVTFRARLCKGGRRTADTIKSELSRERASGELGDPRTEVVVQLR